MIVLTRIVLKETVNNNVDDVLTARVEVISNNSPFQVINKTPYRLGCPNQVLITKIWFINGVDNVN